MKLKDMPLTDPADLFILNANRQMWQELVRSGRVKDGIVRHGVTTHQGSLFPVKTKGAEEFVLYGVFVQKIRRENRGLDDASTEDKRKWYEMAKSFVDEFGEDRTPPDIVDCMLGCKDHLGL